MDAFGMRRSALTPIRPRLRPHTGMTIRLFNTLSNSLEDLRPADGQQTLRMYACGPTVYDYCHIGNFRTFLQVGCSPPLSSAAGPWRAPRHEYYRCG